MSGSRTATSPRSAGRARGTRGAGRSTPTGRIVAPGFVDLHTHYDAQIRWDPWCTISGWHGVTSVVLGNCGFGFAPVKPDFRERSMLTMTRTEAIPYASMGEGMPWDWETIPEYLDSLERAPKGVNVHPVHADGVADDYVMGLEAAKTRPATDSRAQGDAAPAARGHGRRPVRLLHPAPRAELGAGRLRRLADGHRHDVRRRHPRARRGAAPSATRASSRSRRPPATSGPTSRSSRSWPPWRNRPILHNVVAPSRNDAEVHRRPLRWIDKCRAAGPADVRPVRHRPRRLRLHARALEPVRRLAGVARRHHRHARTRRSRRCATPSCGARWSTRPKRPTVACGRSRPASAATRTTSIIQGVNRQAEPAAVRRSLGRRHRRGRGQAPDRSDARPVARRRSATSSSSAPTRDRTPSSWPR